MPRSAAFKRRGYHHGNLREALLAAARRLIAERGPAGFTLVEAARQAGVSPAAPYRHFKDRDALVEEVRRRGFEEFGRRLEAAWQSAAKNPAAAFARMGEAYLQFAGAEPGYYAAMFAPGPENRSRGFGRPAERGSFRRLQAAIAQTFPGVPGAEAEFEALAFQVWALSHGIASLAAAGFLAPKRSPAAALKAGVAALMAGASLPGASFFVPEGEGGSSRSEEPGALSPHPARRFRGFPASPPGREKAAAGKGRRVTARQQRPERG